jgi:hypothetical protein
MWKIQLLLIVFICSIIGLLTPLYETYKSYPFGNSDMYPLWSFGSFINMPTRFTRNQSYDLRGDPFIIPVNPFLSPWGMSTYF